MNASREKKHVVIVGGGFGGLSCAKGLARQPVRVTLIDRENHHLFQPLLYQVATATLSAGDIASPIRTIFRSQKNIRVWLGEAIGADLESRHLFLADGAELKYDYLVIAAGAKTNFFGHDQWERHAYPLKSLRDALRVRERVLMAFEAAEREEDPDRRRALLTFVVVGAGPTGVEMAGAISELSRHSMRDFRLVRPTDIRVILVEMGDRVLSPFDPELSIRAKEQLEALEVEVWTKHRVTNVLRGGVEVDGEWIDASIVIWASGVKPVSIAERLGVELAPSGIVVEQDWSIPGHPEVFAIGDIARFVPDGEERPLAGVSQVAMQGGKHVARQIAGDRLGLAREGFVYWDKGIMATIGRTRAVFQSGRIQMHGYVAWLGWLAVHIFFLIGFRNRISVFVNWVWQYVMFRWGSRLVAEPKGWAAHELAALLHDDTEKRTEASDPAEERFG
jgi:NADH dehydrogenase